MKKLSTVFIFLFSFFITSPLNCTKKQADVILQEINTMLNKKKTANNTTKTRRQNRNIKTNANTQAVASEDTENPGEYLRRRAYEILSNLKAIRSLPECLQEDILMNSRKIRSAYLANSAREILSKPNTLPKYLLGDTTHNASLTEKDLQAAELLVQMRNTKPCQQRKKSALKTIFLHLNSK